MTADTRPAGSPTLADQVSKLYEFIAGSHATHMIEIGRQLGAWNALSAHPGMPTRFAALAQWYELTWGNVVDTRAELHALRGQAGLDVIEETGFSRFHIVVAEKPA